MQSSIRTHDTHPLSAIKLTAMSRVIVHIHGKPQVSSRLRAKDVLWRYLDAAKFLDFIHNHTCSFLVATNLKTNLREPLLTPLSTRSSSRIKTTTSRLPTRNSGVAYGNVCLSTAGTRALMIAWRCGASTEDHRAPLRLPRQ